MQFPATRLRRLRSTPAMRRLVRETTLQSSQLIYPLFLREGKGVRHEVSSMPGVFNLSIDEAMKEVEVCAELGIGGLLLFGIPDEKDDQGSGAYDSNGIMQRGLRTLKAHPDARQLVFIADVCLCEYTSHGHCGVVRPKSSPEELRELEAGALDFAVDNDASLPLLARTAVSLAEAGADIVAPSDMMDGRIHALREALDSSGQHDTPIMSYASKFASAFYGPFREAAASAPQFGDRRSYQMDGANRREAMREIDQDVAQGADMLLMKPGMPYLDILRDARDRFNLPLGVYQVSGEYSMLCAAFQRGWLQRQQTILESLLSFRRAGADFIVTYFAKEAAQLLNQGTR